MPGRTFVTGASGFVGRAVVEELTSRGFPVNALARRGQVSTASGDVRTITGDLFDDKALDEGLRDADGVVHLVGIIAEKRSRGATFERIHHQGARRIVDAANRHGVRRYIHMSALGTRADAVSDYHKTKYEAEQYVRASGLDWTIIRPSLIHGPGGEFMKMETGWVRRQSPPYLFMPYFGAGPLGLGGAGLIQPVYVKDVARAFVDALERPQTIGKAYDLGGPETMTWPQMHRKVAVALVGKPRAVMALPAWYAKLLTAMTPAFLLPFNRDQVIMSQEGSTCDLTPFPADFGWGPREFVEALESYKSQL
jgi:NADH dehydrogenase